jgi:predicted Zn-dependent protease
VVFRGLLDFAGSEAAIVGVLGHELSHLDRQHQLQSIRRMKYASQAFSQERFSPEQFFSTGAVLMKGFMRPFRPEHESEADADGIRWAYELGYDPREFAAVFKRLYERDGEQNAVPFLQTHPFRMDRYRDGMQQARELVEADESRTLYLGRRNLNERIPRDVKRFDE